MDGYYHRDEFKLLVHTSASSKSSTKQITVISSGGLVSRGYHVTRCFAALRDEQEQVVEGVLGAGNNSTNKLFIEMDLENCGLIIFMTAENGFFRYTRNGSCNDEGTAGSASVIKLLNTLYLIYRPWIYRR